MINFYVWDDLGFWLFYDVFRMIISQMVEHHKMVKYNTFVEFFW
jgi:hypothetical protein